MASKNVNDFMPRNTDNYGDSQMIFAVFDVSFGQYKTL